MSNNLFANLRNFGGKVCLIDNGKIITYSEFQSQVNDIAEQLKLNSDIRKLVFLEVHNSVISIATYVACIQNNHPVLLLNPDNSSLNNTLNNIYKPNLFINTVGGVRIK